MRLRKPLIVQIDGQIAQTIPLMIKPAATKTARREAASRDALRSLTAYSRGRPDSRNGLRADIGDSNAIIDRLAIGPACQGHTPRATPVRLQDADSKQWIRPTHA